jgi:hypothetical protein
MESALNVRRVVALSIPGLWLAAQAIVAYFVLNMGLDNLLNFFMIYPFPITIVIPVSCVTSICALSYIIRHREWSVQCIALGFFNLAGMMLALFGAYVLFGNY